MKSNLVIECPGHKIGSCLRVATPNHPLPQPVPSRDPTHPTRSKKLWAKTCPCLNATPLLKLKVLLPKLIGASDRRPCNQPWSRSPRTPVRRTTCSSTRTTTKSTSGRTRRLVSPCGTTGTLERSTLWVVNLEIIDAMRSYVHVCDLLCVYLFYTMKISNSLFSIFFTFNCQHRSMHIFYVKIKKSHFTPKV